MDRRRFLKVCAALPGVAVLAKIGVASAAAGQRTFEPRPGRWRTFELTTDVKILQPAGVTRVWLPIPSVSGDFQKQLGDTWSGNARLMKLVHEGPSATGMLYAEFDAAEIVPAITLKSRVETQDRAVDWARTGSAPETPADHAQWTKPTELMPTDGIVGETAHAITHNKATDVEKVQAIYDWVVLNTYRELAVRGCGAGDVRAMLEKQQLGGKCGDINGLFVALVRAAGVPARDLYGIRVAPSAFGYKALGAASATVTKAQHCRAEVFLRDYGWVAMDPADVGKVAREETSEWLQTDDPIVAAVRPKLFGGWEGHWVAFNTAHDVALPNASRAQTLAFFMYPQAETAAGFRDALAADTFQYTITARAI